MSTYRIDRAELARLMADPVVLEAIRGGVLESPLVQAKDSEIASLRSEVERLTRERDEARCASLEAALRDLIATCDIALVPVEAEDTVSSPCLCEACRQRVVASVARARRALEGDK